MAETVPAREPLVALGVRACALSALAALLTEGDSSAEAAFLSAHSVAQGRNGSLPQLMTSAVQRRDSADVPLLELGDKLGLHSIEFLTVGLAAAVETDVMCGRAIAHLQAPVGGSRPTLGLLSAAFAEFESEGQIVERLLTGAAVGSGLLQILNEGAPLAERALAVPVPLCLALGGRDAAWPGTALGLEDVPEILLPPSVLAEAPRQARALTAGSVNTLLVRSGAATETRAVAHEIASALGSRPLFIEMERNGSQGKTPPHLYGLGPFLLSRGLIPVFCFDPGPGERRSVPALPHYSGPVLALCGNDGSIEARGESPPTWRIGVPPREERRRLWQVAIGNAPLAARLASDYRHGSGRIAQLGRMVRQKCLLDGRSEPAFSDIAAASWVSQGFALEALAQPLPDLIPDEALVAGSVLRGELSRLLLRCRRRESLIDGLGASAVARYRPGVRTLFTGPSGTGKTLAAGWLATQLGLPLYRADLAAVTSKYIGETEKNLAHLLAHAEESGIILLFDEADSLFGKRTEVKESNDRFANAQTNYLLQRIETFDGIALLTSNSRARFDPAFCRRLDIIVEFPLPGAEERRLLWLSHLGAHHRLSHKELNRLAAASDLAGGHIRNAVLTAAVLAQAGNRTIEYGDIFIGLSDEYRKLNRQAPQELAPSV
jgi:ATPase family associated with various cellular activities (AAA)